MEFALVVPLLLGVVLAVLRIGAWFLDMAAANAAAHDAARAVARTGGTVAVARRFLPPGAGAEQAASPSNNERERRARICSGEGANFALTPQRRVSPRIP